MLVEIISQNLDMFSPLQILNNYSLCNYQIGLLRNKINAPLIAEAQTSASLLAVLMEVDFCEP